MNTHTEREAQLKSAPKESEEQGFAGKSMTPPAFGFQDAPTPVAQLYGGGDKATTYPYNGEITGATTVALRSKASKDPEHPYDNILADLPRGTVVKVVGKVGGWLKVEWNGKSGYVSQELVKEAGKTSDAKGNEPETCESFTTEAMPPDYCTWDAATPERITIILPGIKVGQLAQDLYEDSQLIEALHAVPELDYTPSAEEEIPVGTVVRIEYRYLKPELQALFDNNISVTSREGWGAQAPDTEKDDYTPYTQPLEEVLHSIAIHHSGNSNKHTMNEVEDEHRDPEGEYKLGDVGYHFGIGLDGEIFEGRPIDVKGSHISKGNTGVVGIVMLADLESGYPGILPDFDDDVLEAKMEASMLQLVHHLVGKYPGITHLGGHQEFNSGRSCPGDISMEKMEGWRASTGLTKPKPIN